MTGHLEGLERFLAAQDESGTYALALAELRAGQKQSHWMWFIFPQIAGLGHSPVARHYAIADRAEADCYLQHPVLGPRLLECVGAVQNWAARKYAEAIFGPLDALKFRSSISLFKAAASSNAEQAPFSNALQAFYDGLPDLATLARL